jgi:hypothetical protein
MTELNISLKVTFTLHEIKQLVIDNIEKAHDINNPDCLFKCTDYFNWHFPLIKFYEKNKKTQPTMADKLCFVILLSYPKHIIESLNDISDIKLFSHDNTDFIYIQELCLNHAENETGSYDCICSYERLQNIHFVQNKYSGITLQVGSECITKHNLISNGEIKKFKETEKLLKEKRKEIKEGKPIGYYKEEKKIKKEEKEREKEEKENEKIQKKIKTGNFKRCYKCDINIVDIRKDNLCICNKCKNNINEDLCCEIKKHGLNECVNCNNNFIDVIQNDPYLCKNCKSQNKIIKCRMSLCSTLLLVDINTNNVSCDDCEKKIITCIDCKIGFIQDTCESRCECCQYIYENRLVNKTCVVCNEEMAVKQCELWRTYCTTCYRRVQDTIKNPPKCNCGLNMIQRTIKRGENQGRKGLGCPKYPNGCNKFQIL